MKISRDEQVALNLALEIGKAHGYGNVISHLQTAWAKTLMSEYGMDEKSARLASGGSGYPFQMHEDLIQRGMWDETGERYAKAKS